MFARIAILLYAIVSYAVFTASFLYALGFVGNYVVPKSIDTSIDVGAPANLGEAIVVNLLLMSLFAIQHSVMARPAFKRWSAKFLPVACQRSTYVLLSSLILLLLFWQWRPMPSVVWQVKEPVLAAAIVALSFVGWLIALTSTYLINHFELFGLHQVANNLSGKAMPAPQFRTPLYYKFVRHPLYLGFIIAFWAAPTMTAGHLLFAAVTTAYIVVGALLEENDLVSMFGDEYRRYRKNVAMLVPWRKAA